MPHRRNQTHRRWISALGIPLLLLSAGTRLEPAAVAQVLDFDAATIPSNVATTGLSEILGEVFLTAKPSCGDNTDALCVNDARTIQIRYSNVVIDNSIATGILVCESVSSFVCNDAGNFLTGEITVAGDTISIGVKQDANLAAFDRLTIAGVRGRIATGLMITPGTESLAVVSAIPPAAANFPPDTLVAARSVSPLSLQVTGVPEIPCAAGEAVPTVLVGEGFPSFFVDYGDPLERTRPGQPLLPRNPLGGNTNTRISLTLTGLAPDVQVHWPVTVAAQNSTAVLDLISQSVDGSTATYLYGVINQLQSDGILELFAVRLEPQHFRFSGSPALSGIVSVQGRLLPAAVPTSARPRFDHPLGPEPGLPYFLLKRCPSSGAAVGSANIRATLDGQQWTGSLYYHLEGPVPRNGTLAPQTATSLPVGNYAVNLLSGGPPGAHLAEITPSNTQLIFANSSTEFVFNFTGPTTAILELSATPLALCPAASTTVGTFQLANNSGDTQILAAGTALEFTFSRPLVKLPAASGFVVATVSSSITSVKYVFPEGLTLPAGAVLSFAETELDMSGMPDGQGVTVLLTSIPMQAIQVDENQTTLATAELAACPPPPAILPTGIMNGASFEPGLSPGSIAALFGAHITGAGGFVLASEIPLPRQIAGTSLTVNGMAAPLFAVANVGGQELISFQVPWEVVGQLLVTVIVNNNGQVSNPVLVVLQSVMPGIFTIDGTAGAILHGASTSPVTAADPAAAGELVTIYATGLGPVSATPATGAAALAEPQSITGFTPTVTVAGMPATVEFSGLAPGFVGLYQVDVKLPPGVPAGNQTVVLTVAGKSSKPATIAIE